MLSSFEKEELFCYFCVCFSWEKTLSPELQLFWKKKKADKTKGPASILRLLRHALSGAQSGICSQVLSKPSQDGPFGGVAISDLMCKDITEEGR